MKTIGKKTTNKIFPIDDYYCSMKFRFLKVDLQRNTISTCHAARPQAIDYEWLKQNPGDLFNSTININEREQMLRNERAESCEQNCWHAEERGAESPRIVQGGKTHMDIPVHTRPTLMDITLDFNCNLTCSYCTKEYSSSWSRDLLENGDYVITDYTSERFVSDDRDIVLNRVSQNEIAQSKKRQLILEESLDYLDGVEELTITGGEPLLSKELIDILEKAKQVPSIILYTGLGMSYARFKLMIEQIKQFSNVTLYISMENIGDMLEFNRYGIVWTETERKINLVKKLGINHLFQTTLTNLTLLGFVDFYNTFKDSKIITGFGYQPRFMAPYVMDQTTKNQLLEDIQDLPNDIKEKIKQGISYQSDEKDARQLKDFLLQYTNRRKDLDLRIFPKSFLDWMNINVV